MFLSLKIKILFRYKDIIAREIDCNNNIYILKSGDAKCFIRISRSQIKNHQKTLESNATTSHFIESSRKYCFPL